MNERQVTELLYQALETEMGGQEIYCAAIQYAQVPELRKEWQKYLEETTNHERVLRELFNKLGMDPEVRTPGRDVVRKKGAALVAAMRRALADGGTEACQFVAAESVVETETRDHQNWALIGLIAAASKGAKANALRHAYEQVKEEEDQHLYHTMGWARELWIKSLGFAALVPPPEEEKMVNTAIGAARAEQSREKMLKR